MQPTISLRNAIVATILASPVFINGLALPWGNSLNAIAARSFLTGGVVDTNFHEVRANKGSESTTTPSASAAPSGTPTGRKYEPYPMLEF